MDEIITFLVQNKEKALEDLKEFLRLQSISSDPDFDSEVKATANWLKNFLVNIGLTNTRLYETPGHPIVYSENLYAGVDAPTVLIYGHYDVQPVVPLELWDTPPFEPTIKDGFIFGRGTSDDKGQLFAHIKAIEAILKTKGKLPVNIKLLIEGEEESGSNNLDNFIIENKELLKCDTVLISDTEWFADGLPSICYSLRGIAFIEITFTGPDRDLHSGTYGGAVENPINALCDVISRLKDKYGRITIPGFYDDVLDLSEAERKNFKKLPYNEENYKNELGIQNVFGELGYTTLERAWARPTLDVNGIWGGYTGQGAKTIIPSKASAKISMRLVPEQKNRDITDKVIKYIKSITPPTMQCEIIEYYGGEPVLIKPDSKPIKIAMKALEKAFGAEAVFMREGGSIPIVSMFQSELNAPVVLMGLGLPGDNIHSPNENLKLENYFGGIKASTYFLTEYSEK